MCPCASPCRSMCVCECLSFQSGVSMELSCLGQTSGSVGREPWVNFKLLPPSRRKRPRQSVQQIGCTEHVWNCVGKRTKTTREYQSCCSTCYLNLDFQKSCFCVSSSHHAADLWLQTCWFTEKIFDIRMFLFYNPSLILIRKSLKLLYQSFSSVLCFSRFIVFLCCYS